MTRHQGFDVRIAPEVEQSIRKLSDRQGASSDTIRDVRAAMHRLTRHGTRANGAKKLRSLDLWEIRAGQYRVYFCPVPKSQSIAIGALAAKTTRKIPMRKLKTIERTVLRWRNELSDVV